MNIPFQSFSKFVQSTLVMLEKGELAQGGHISIELSPATAKNILDLFVLGRLLAFVHELQRSYNISVEMVVLSRKLQENLGRLGFFNYCNTKGISLKLEATNQGKLFEYDDPFAVVELRPITSKDYWSCVVPLTRFRIENLSTESSVAAAVGGYIEQIEVQIIESFGKLGIDYRDVSHELARLLLVIVRELVSNTVSHSTADEFLVAMTISRENETALRGPNRRGLHLEPGQDKYEFLVTDLGRGIYPSVEGTLNDHGSCRINTDYCAFRPWRDDLNADKAREESLVSNIFRGDLVIRKGRRSEGLNELGKSLSWFGGILSFHTGRTGAHISAMSSDEFSVVPDPRPKPYYLPGVTMSLLLPAPQLKSGIMRSFEPHVPASFEAESQACILQAFPCIPSGLFGGSGGKKARRRSELDAQYLIDEYEKLISEAGSESKFWAVDLKLSHSINVDFFDGLLQELAKRIDQVETGSSKNFFKLIFLNIPRDVINSLRKRNCRSFLALKDTFCLLLDEADEPHFLGVPRASKNLFDVEDALKLVYFTGIATEAALVARLGLSNEAVSRLQYLLEGNPSSLFSVGVENGSTVYRSRALRAEIYRLRLSNQKGLRYSLVPGAPNTIHRLRNGEYVDRVVNFCDYWSRSNSLIDVAKLLIAETGSPVVDTVLCFMDNGDRLASVLRRVTEISNIVILDPLEPVPANRLVSLGRCVLVVDALYPGDDNAGYVKACVVGIGHRSSIEKIYAFHDYLGLEVARENADAEPTGTYRKEFLGIPVYSVPVPAGFPAPRRIAPDANVSIILDRRDASSARPKPVEDRSDDGSESARTVDESFWGTYQFSPIELSTEFWQNVSELGIIDTGEQGREKRSVLFYEHNEKFIQTPRMLNYATEFISEFVKNSLDSGVDAIVHPSHAVGSFLAGKVAEQLSANPLILPLTQNEYGGAITITANDYREFRARVDKLERSAGRALSCLILDDSVLSGNSIFTMIGIVSNLGMNVGGILTLLNRLTPEVSQAIAEMTIPFGYLYRLHMPILGPPHRPDKRLSELNDQIMEQSSSNFAQNRAKKLSVEGSHFRVLPKGLNADAPPTIANHAMDSIEGKFTDTHKLKHIINNLILHRDGRILDFNTRIAIAYNFLDRLVLEDSFWSLLVGLFGTNGHPAPDSQNTLFIRKIIYVLAFSQHVQKNPARLLYSDVCTRLVGECFKADHWIEHKDLISESLMGQGVVLSEDLVKIAFVVLEKILPFILNGSSWAESGDTIERSEFGNGRLERSESAKSIAEALAWSLHLYISKKGVSIFESDDIRSRLQDLSETYAGTEAELVLIDLFRPAISSSDQLRQALEIDEWGLENRFLKLLCDPEQNASVKYLMDAPGYTCTLKSVLKICKADTILLYAKNEADEGFALRVFESRVNKKPDKALNIEYLGQSMLPIEIQERMHDSLFFRSNEAGIVEALDVFLTRSTHTWCMGSSINIQNSPISYYVVLGYKNRSDSPQFQKTAYYYWLECEPLLREILPAIHARYIGSAAIWNIQAQAIRPYHPSSWGNQERSSVVNARRRLISNAMQSVDLGELVTQAVRMSFESATTAARIREDFGIECRRFQTYLEASRSENQKLVNEADWLDGTRWNIDVTANTNHEHALWCTLPTALFKLIGYECLRNALSNSLSWIDTSVSFEKFMDLKDNAEKVWVILKVVNDIHPDSKRFVPKNDFNGIAACKAAAGAVGGKFSSAKTNSNDEIWIAEARIPAFRIPDELRRELHGIL